MSGWSLILAEIPIGWFYFYLVRWRPLRSSPNWLKGLVVVSSTVTLLPFMYHNLLDDAEDLFDRSFSHIRIITTVLMIGLSVVSTFETIA